MLKKTVIILMTVILIFSFAACGGGSKTSSGSTDSNSSSGSSDSKASFSTSMQTLMDNKTKLYNKLSENMPEEMAWAALDMLGISIMDINLAFVLACGTEGAEQGIEAAFKIFGATEVKYTENGTNYKIEAKNSEGEQLNYDIQYDKSTDSMIVTFMDGAAEETIFEAVRIDNGYGFVYDYLNADGKHDVVKGMVYDNAEGIFATGTSDSKPESVYKNDSVFNNDFVKQGMTNVYEVKEGKCYVLFDGQNYEYEAGTGEADTD